jgi:phosphoglycolate phosphatase-like HAD superfamily hydrolase
MKLFVWDLHGTLEQGNDRAVVDISNRVLRSNGFRERFTYEDGQALYGRKWYEYFHWLLGERSYDRALQLQEECFELSECNPQLQYQHIQPTPHAAEVLSAISLKHDQIIISNTREATLDLFIKALELESHFPYDKAFAVDQHMADAIKSKADALRDYPAERPARYEELIFIGDSPSDMEIKLVPGGLSYLYAHPEFSFRQCVADYRIRDLREVLAQV